MKTSYLPVVSIGLLACLWFTVGTTTFAQSYKGFNVGRYQGSVTNRTGGNTGTGKGTLDIRTISSTGVVQAYLRDSDGLEGAGQLTGSINVNGVMQLTGSMTSPSDNSVWQSALIAVMQNGHIRMGNKLTLGNAVQEETATMAFTNATSPVNVNVNQPVQAQTGVGAAYGARNPRACVDKTIPKKGGPTAAQALQQFVCQREGLVVGAASGTTALYLVDNVTIQVAPGRLYRGGAGVDFSIDDLAPGELIYAIRGSYILSICDKIEPDRSNAGKNCNVYIHQKATGVIYKNGFGDWYCSMTDYNHSSFPDKYSVTPPQ